MTGFLLAPTAIATQIMLGPSILDGAIGFSYPAALAAEQNSSGFQTITGEQLSQMLLRKDFFFVNVHIPYAGQIDGTDAFIPYDKIAQNLDKLPADKRAKIVLYCRSGRMSEIAAEQLSKLGYLHVSHLSGGMIAWQASGRALTEH
ncbi:rhodanese-like domain-containing protein [Mesorhizobium humile]|uniref:Rhodanese-like domain-containing protein n=1 Tax=Mesorhizobium humile TaxID=3072313 RepID=A0ABU4YPE0_9HYPH|nr:MULTISPECIES: rhodanese-like domain-containing protein [unclassified Mesorhizobium]MDX8463409.1 rhodanese-like domain-containing protein [Mesorhizobium sp. VK2D]MDX8488846.1 rhodanese-like domain-containing protein [Mesorhizobium sp. VK2B]